MPDSAPSSRPCPVCGSSSSELLYRQRFESFARGSIGDGYDVVACNQCGMCFATGLPDQQRFARFDVGEGRARQQRHGGIRMADRTAEN